MFRMVHEIASALEADIESHSDEMVEFLSALVERETTHPEEGAGQEVVAETFRDLGLEPDIWVPEVASLADHEGYFETTSYLEYGYEDRPNVVATLEGSGEGPSLTISGHMDVVPAAEAEWDRDPWTLTREGDRLFGRGAADMKGGIAAYVAAIESIRRLDIELQGDVILQSTIEEEDGGIGGVLSALERGYRPDAALIPEPFDIPNIGIASAGVIYFRITVEGQSAHAAWGHEGVSAIDRAVPVIAALEELDAERKERIEYAPAYRANPGLKGHETNLNIGVLEAGDWPSTVPGHAVLKGRIGWPPGESRTAVRDEIEAAVRGAAESDPWLQDHPPSIHWVGWQAAPHEVPTDSTIAQLAKRTAADVTGQEGAFVGGNAGLDERFFKRYYDTDVVTVGPEGHNLHGADEYTTLSSLEDTAITIARIIVEYCGTADDRHSSRAGLSGR